METNNIPVEQNIIEKIFHFRGLKVMLDSHLAAIRS